MPKPTRRWGPLIDVARESGTHMLLLHHSGKAPKLDAMDAPLWTTAFGGIPATVIYLKRMQEGYRTIQTVQRIGKDFPETVLNFDEPTKLLTTGGSRQNGNRKMPASGFSSTFQSKDHKLSRRSAKKSKGKLRYSTRHSRRCSTTRKSSAPGPV